MSRGLGDVYKRQPVQFAQALKAGSDKAYKAVMKPKEGTILTVARVIAEDAIKYTESNPDDYDGLMNVILTSGEAILKRTPDMLPPLKAAGVVDSGGRGLMLIYTGYAAVMRGEEIADPAALLAGDSQVEEDIHDLSGDLPYAYCTEYDIVNFREDCTEGDVDSFRRRLNRIGNCVKVTGDLTETKVHVHTNDPGNAIQYGIELGELVNVKVDNMLARKRALEAEKAPAAVEAPAEPAKEFGMVAVSLGDGFSSIFRDLTVDVVVEGGQTMNPSTEDMLNAIAKVNAKTIYIFPNNKNIVLAANQARDLTEDKEIVVVPTKTIPQGITAMISYVPEKNSAENTEAMLQAIEHVKTGQITYAVRDTRIDDKEIHEGDMMGIGDHGILAVGKDRMEVAKETVAQMVDDESEVISIYYGADTEEAEAEELATALEEAYPDCDVELNAGGQPIYYYVISVE